MIDFVHKPVLLEECINGLNIQPGGIYVDGTVGGAGHATEIARSLGAEGLLIGIDRDGTAIAKAELQLQSLSNAPFVLVRDNHENIRNVLESIESVESVNGFLLDLGVSSHQLDTPERGFSYRYDALLDMRMDDRDPLTAHQIVNTYAEKTLAQILSEFGEERYSKRIARAICRSRPVGTTLQLAEIIKNAVPPTPPSQGHPAARTFQAIRIAVNGELTALYQTIEDMVHFLKPGGRICIITFHSLEDRIVKQAFRHWVNPCQCPREIPYCVCGKKPLLSLITRKPVRPRQEELDANPRAHSAKLRIAERV